MGEVGYFLFSLDLELATGRFDQDKVRSRMFSADGSRERESIFRLIDLFEKYGIVGTWATVGHLFYEKCEYCRICPMMDWKGRYSSFEEVYGTSNALWYGADVIELLLTRGKSQEIAFHGYSHEVFDERQMSPQQAEIEVREWMRVSKRKGVVPHAVVYPRHVVGHLDILRESGMICYRREPERTWLIRNKILGRYVKALDQVLGLSRIPIFDLVNIQDHGLVRLFSSQHFFDLNRRFELLLDSVDLHNLRLRRMRKGIGRAAAEHKMIHVWAHPCDFRTEKDFLKLRYVLDAAAREIERGRMRSVGMTEMARIIINRRTDLVH